MSKELNDFVDRIGVSRLCPEGLAKVKAFQGTNDELWESLNNPTWMLLYARRIGISNEVIRSAIEEINSIKPKDKIAKHDCDVIRKHMTAGAMRDGRLKKTKELDDMEKIEDIKHKKEL